MKIISDFKDFYDWIFYKGSALHDPYYTYRRFSTTSVVKTDRFHHNLFQDEFGFYLKIGDKTISDSFYAFFGDSDKLRPYSLFEEGVPGSIRQGFSFFSGTLDKTTDESCLRDNDYFFKKPRKSFVTDDPVYFREIEDISPVTLLLYGYGRLTTVIRNPRISSFRNMIPFSDNEVGQLILQWFADKAIPKPTMQDNRSKITSHGFDLKTSFRGKQ